MIIATPLAPLSSSLFQTLQLYMYVVVSDLPWWDLAVVVYAG